MGKLRDQMSKDLELRGLRPTTRSRYLLGVKNFAAHFMKSPEEMGREEVRSFLDHVASEQSLSTCRVTWCALNFLYTQTLNRPEVMDGIIRPRSPKRKTPVVVSGTEMEEILRAIPSLKHRTITMLLYGAGLRVSEGCRLEIACIDSRRNALLIKDGKGGLDRYTILGPRLLEGLRHYYRIVRPRGKYLFPGMIPGKPITVGAYRNYFYRAIADAKIGKAVTPHTLRHSCGTHLLELGINLRTIQVLLGHASIRSTTIYTKVALKTVSQLQSPLDILGTSRADVLG